jgi:altronate dehydratase
MTGVIMNIGHQRWLRLNAADNVRVVVDPAGLRPGDTVEGITLRDAVGNGHKVASSRIPKGGTVVKFGHVIGVATRDIEPGSHVHVHNVEMPSPELCHGDEEVHRERARAVGTLPTNFKGYRRPNGRAGTRNYVVVVSSVNCSATVVKAVCRNFLGRPEVDGVVPVTHQSGCAQAIGGLGYQVLNRTLAGWIFHPNVVGAVVIGLGCEGTTFKSILEARQMRPDAAGIPLETLNIQDVGGTAECIRKGTEAVEKVLKRLPRFERVDIPVSELGIALNCGGSDAFSSLTANPALGIASDLLVQRGGMVALAEIPECHGCEDMLAARAESDAVRKRLDETFAWWNDYATRHEVSLNNNLAAGNIAGGITTIVEKSLGAVAKGGHTPLKEIVEYSDPIRSKGFVLMNTPGFDPVSVTGLVAGGCNLVAFTTGRGSVFGCAIAPTVKIATTSALFSRMRGDMDFDAGRALTGMTIEQLGEELYLDIVAVASGRRTTSEELGLGWEEFVPWPIAETL